MSITIIGGGNMGSAIARSILSHRLFPREQVTIVEPIAQRREAIARELDCPVSDSLSKDVLGEIIVLAVKPQDLRVAAEATRDILSSESVVVSILAGVSLPALRSFFPRQKKFVRCMPNTPMQIGEGMTAMVFDGSTSVAERELVTRLFSISGKVLVLTDERLMNAVTAVSGSGPAYLFYFAEHLCKAATELGFSSEEAHELVSQTLKGAVMLWQQSGKPPEELRKQVTSKGGTTAAAVSVFDAGRFGDIVQAALLRASERGKELERLSKEQD